MSIHIMIAEEAVGHPYEELIRLAETRLAQHSLNYIDSTILNYLSIAENTSSIILV